MSSPKSKRKDPPEDEGPASESAKTMYLVLEHGVEAPAYSVFRVDAAAAGSRRARHLIRLPDSQHAMSFVAVHSTRSSWIVGVGGAERSPTIIYDPSTHEQFQGPRPMSAKRDPVLISHSGNVYSFSRRPEIKPDLGYVRWFEFLSFKNGPGSSVWEDLLPPPFFPFVLTPRQYLNPPKICLLSYAAVGSYILLSYIMHSPEQQQQPGGTFAFHVRKKTWAKVDENNLPFIGDAVPLGGNYFASRSKARCATAVFYLKVEGKSSEPARLSVLEFPVASENKIPGQLLCPLGGGSFCAIDLMSSRPSSQAGMLKTAQVIVTTCQMKMKKTELEDSEAEVKEQRLIYRFCDRTRCLASPMPLVAALSMQIPDVFEEKPRKKHAAPLIFSTLIIPIEASK